MRRGETMSYRPTGIPKTAAERLSVHEERLAALIAWQADTQRQFMALDNRLRRVELLLWLAILTGFINLLRSAPAIARLFAGHAIPRLIGLAHALILVHF